MPSVELILGPMLVGVFVNMILYGVLVVQTFIYYRTYKKDTPWIRYFVLYLFVVETLNTGFDIGMMYQPLILEYGSTHSVDFFPTMFASEPIMIVAVSTPIQMFLAWRIMVITRFSWIAAIICTLAIVAFAGGIWTTVMIAIIQQFARKPELHWPALLWFISSCIADVLITVSLVRSLSQRKTGFTATDDVLDRIIRLTVQTGMVTAIAAIGDVIFFLVLPHTALNFLWDLALSKLYTNSLMSTLNARAGWNNITSGRSQGNILFGDAPGTRRQTDIYTNNSRVIGTAMYDLEGAQTLDPTASSKAGDLEYGITVTRVVERIEDPLPSPPGHIAASRKAGDQ